MNIFVTDPCPIKAAKNLANKHSSRMPLETAGMLAFAFGEDQCVVANKRSNRHYKHPASIWARQSRENFEWLLEHGMEQSKEYRRRYKREHKSEADITWMARNYKKMVDFQELQITPYARCFSSFKEELQDVEDAIMAYRQFYILDKKDFAKWPSLEEIPNWWIEQSNEFVDKNFKDGQYTKR
jgi:hypothetical protein